MKPRKQPGGDEDFQMAPMIDMVFLLLVFFMTVSTMAQAEKIPLPLPVSEKSDVPDDLSGRGIISLKEEADGSYGFYIAKEKMELEEIKATVREAVSRNPETQIMVRASQTTPYKEIKRVLKACAEAGAYEIIYATYQL